jgi:hypothetical protein
MNLTAAHIKALLDHSQTREGIWRRLRNQTFSLPEGDIFSSADFPDLHDAALDTLVNGEAPAIKTYLMEGSYGDYPIEIMGVEGAYIVCALEEDAAGVFGTLREAEDYIGVNWCGEARET